MEIVLSNRVSVKKVSFYFMEWSNESIERNELFKLLIRYSNANLKNTLFTSVYPA